MAKRLDTARARFQKAQAAFDKHVESTHARTAVLGDALEAAYEAYAAELEKLITEDIE